MANWSEEDTIVAPATPPGEGAVAIVRLSGGRSQEFLRKVLRPAPHSGEFESHRFYYGSLFRPQSELPIDEVMAVVMKAPRSYTREDVVEIHCHGNGIVVGNILQVLVDLGARIARPGEFTLRAFANGRLDLSRAEAVADIIGARSSAASLVALRQLAGNLSSFVYALREQLVEMLALVETYIDFPDEEFERPEHSRLERQCREALLEIGRVLEGFEAGRTLREGLSVLLLGRPNVGKSSLLNALLGEARAIVTDIPGTTRDFIEGHLTLGGIPLKLLDTAGVRHSLDPIEMEGVRRARDKVAGADLVLLIIDGSAPPCEEDALALQDAGEGRVLLVRNKADLGLADLPPPFDTLESVAISARRGDGLDDLKRTLSRLFLGSTRVDNPESVLLSDQRHRSALIGARDRLREFLDGLALQLPSELLALEIRSALQCLGEITGETTPDEVLDQIFSRFCIGK